VLAIMPKILPKQVTIYMETGALSAVEQQEDTETT
jgi:hypothetical protein